MHETIVEGSVVSCGGMNHKFISDEQLSMRLSLLAVMSVHTCAAHGERFVENR